MIGEFAIEPEVMANWVHFRELWEDLGVSRGRLISEYPSDWREQVCRKAYEQSSTKAASIAVRLKPGPGETSAKKWISTSRSYDRGKDWLANAEHQKKEENFSAIVARKNPRDNSRVLVAGDFPKDMPPWRCERQCKIPRTPQEMARCAVVLLAASDEIQLVDPNFDATELRFREPLAAFLSVRRPGRSWRRCELHTKRPEGNRAFDNRKVHCTRFLPQCVPAGCNLRVHFWSHKPDGEKLHPRFLLTELGGLQFDYGLDLGDKGEKTIVTLLEDSLWFQLRQDYSLTETGTFNLKADAVIEIAGDRDV